MTVTLFIGRRTDKVDNSLLQGSELVENMINDLHQEDVDIVVPSVYSSVINFYLDFINKIFYNEKGGVVYLDDLLVINDTDDLVLCFFMETFFADSTFFIYLMQQAYDIWDEFYPNISLLPDERLIYLYTPYELIPDKYKNRESFFKEWLSINANKNIVLNGNSDEVYHTDVAYYPTGQVKELKIYRVINRVKTSSHERAWYANGQAMYRLNYKDGKLDGLQEAWYESGRPKYRHNYKDGKEDGLQEYCYESGQDKYRWNYKDGKLDGLQEGWYGNGQLRYRRLYDMDTLIKEEFF